MTETGRRAEGSALEPRERERLLHLLRRSDALGMGLEAYESDPHEDAETKEETLGILREEDRRAHEEFVRYRAEVGIPDPVRKNARKPA